MDYKVKPWAHQAKAIALSQEIRDLALFFEMGTGKTSTTINILRHKYASAKRIMKTLILCPIVVCENWRREFQTHSAIGSYVIVLSGSEKKRLKEFNLKKDTKPRPIFVTNYEALNMKGLLQAILQWRPEIFVADESQKLKAHNSKRSKAAALIADRTEHNYILSGTPILNSAMDIYGQYRVLDRGSTFGRNFTHFRAKYFFDENAGMPKQSHFAAWIPRTGIEQEINDLIYAKALRVLKSECLDLPDLVRTQIPVELAPEQKRLYMDMKRDFIAYLQGGEAVVAQIAITKALRLQQLVSGYAKTDMGEEISLKENPRMDALYEILEELPVDAKVIIWACFAENYRQIRKVCEKLGLSYSELHGEVSGKDRQNNIDAFQRDPKVRVMIANQQAGGVGVNLTAASYSVFYSRNFSLEADLQAEARNHRGGSEIHQKITRIDLVATGTIDEVIMDSLRNKFDLSERILALKDRL